MTFTTADKTSKFLRFGRVTLTKHMRKKYRVLVAEFSERQSLEMKYREGTGG
jgi:hypothetical protein